jgi:uncharacterized protein YcbX
VQQVGVVALLARYPVKSMGGEELEAAQVEARGLVGDRAWAVVTEDGGIGSGKTTRRFRRVDGLLEWRAVLDEGVPVVESPAGERYGMADAGARLSEGMGRPLRIEAESDVPHHDESPVHVLTTASLRGLGQLLGEPVDVARFRPNVVLEVEGEGFPEDEWTGRELALGDEVVLRLGPGMPRCVMVGLPQGDLRKDKNILRTLAQERDLAFGLQASVVRGGLVRVGDPASLR